MLPDIHFPGPEIVKKNYVSKIEIAKRFFFLVLAEENLKYYLIFKIKF